MRAVDKLTGPVRAMTATLNQLTAPTRKLSKEFSRFSDATGFSKVSEGFHGVGGAVKNVAGEASALAFKLFAITSAATFAFISITRGAVEAGDKLAMMADRVGVAVDYYASLSYAANQADVDQEEFNGAMDKFSKALGEAKANGGPLLDFLKKVSPRLGEQIKGAKGAEQAMSILTDAFVRLQDPQKRAALATAAFGRSGAQMGEFLHQGSAAIQKQQIAFFKLAGSQEGFARSASDLDDSLKDLDTAFLGVRAAIASGLFPAFTQIAGAVTDFVVSNREGIAAWAKDTGAAIAEWVKGGGLQRLGVQIRDVARGALEFVDAIGGFKTVALAAAAVMAGPLLLAIAALVPPIISVGVALLTTPFGWFVLAAGGIAAAGILIYKNWGPVKKFFEEFFPDQIKAVRELADGIQLIYDLWKKLSNATGGNLGRNILYQVTGGQAGSNLSEASENALKAQQAAQPQASWADAAETIKSLWNYRVGQPLGPTGPGAYAQKVQVQVDFKNTPRGTRVNATGSDDADVNLNAGYSMADSH